MNLFGVMETSGSAMQAERIRAEVVAANMANAETTRTESGGPYQRQHVVFAANQGEKSFSTSISKDSRWATAIDEDLPVEGVHIAQVFADKGLPLKRFDP